MRTDCHRAIISDSLRPRLRDAAAQIERAEGWNVLACAYARARWNGKFTPAHDFIAGGLAVFAGYWTHLTRAMGIGSRGTPTPLAIRELSRFFEDRSAIPTVSVASVCHEAQRAFLASGYREVGRSVVLWRDTTSNDLRQAPHIRIDGQSDPHWIAASTQGFCCRDQITADETEIGGTLASMPEAVLFSVRSDADDLCATAAFAIWGGVGVLFGDSTRVPYRGMGFQSATIYERIRYGRALGCQVLTAEVEPGSGSERNYRRGGFTKAYERLTLQRG